MTLTAGAIKLTVNEWGIVQEQCRKCQHWDDINGCLFPDANDANPAEDCAAMEAKQ